MAYQVTTFDLTGRPTGSIGSFANIASARQAVLDHSKLISLPNGEPFSVLSMNLIEGWFIGSAEYNIEVA